MAHDAPFHSASQRGPRPLPLFLELLRNETAASPARRAAALAGLRAYQQAQRHARSDTLPRFARADRASLIDYGGTGPVVVLIPSLINPPHILDLTPDNSLARFLATQGFHSLLVDWGVPTLAARDLDISGHIETLLLPMLETLPGPITVIGYCLGGTMAVAVAALRPIAGLALIATPWHFSGFSDAARADMMALWAQAAPICDALGVLPAEVLQAAFWHLDPGRTISKFERFGQWSADSAKAQAFVILEDWANGGAPLSFSAGKQAFTDFFGADLPGKGQWRVKGKAIIAEALSCPVLDIVSLSDRIVPAATAAKTGSRIALDTGHVGMVIGGQAQATPWEPLVRWLSQLKRSC